jgi:TIR domain
MGHRCIRAGHLGEQEIPKALKALDLILIFFSENSIMKRGYVQREFKLTIDIWKEIPEGMIHTIPVRLDQCRIPDQFRMFQGVDLFGTRGFDRILQAIRLGLTQRKRPSH